MPKPASTPHVALLRGINVGGKNKLPMTELVAMFERHGAEAVQTYIQSGNVLFRAPPKTALALPKLISGEIEKTLGFAVPIVVRSAEALAAAVKANPYLSRKANPDALHVMFLAEPPDSMRVATLDPKRSPTDTFEVVGSQIYLYCPTGYGNSKLTNAYFDSKLATVSTCRNWKTTQKLLTLAEALA